MAEGDVAHIDTGVAVIDGGTAASQIVRPIRAMDAILARTVS